MLTNLSGEHAAHVVEKLVAENLPSGQSMHDVAPDEAEYEPAAQFVHADAAAPEYVPGGHVTHMEEALFDENLPAGQFTHVFCDVDPYAAEYVPAEHLWHCRVPVWLAYVPTLQKAQEKELSLSLNLPTAHGVHSGNGLGQTPLSLP
jgi:hypothetical protein